MNHDTEVWANIPDMPNYMVSNEGNVRHTSGAMLTGTRTAKGTVYRLHGRTHTLDELMRRAFDLDEDDDFETEPPDEVNRELSYYELREIRTEEGIKPAEEVGRDFRILPERVRAIWDGAE